MLVIRTASGTVKSRPSKPYVSAALANLQPGRSIVLERVEEKPGDWYVQGWMQGGRDWREPFMWNNIGSQFAADETDLAEHSNPGPR